MIAALRWVNLVFAVLAILPPAAHVLELPNKLALDGPLWLAIQQRLYRGWGPFLGAPAEIGALATTLALLVLRRRSRPAGRLTLIAALAYIGMIAVFFLLNAPVNNAVGGWTAATLPSDWPVYRLRWEMGHTVAALFAATGLLALLRAGSIAAPADTSEREQITGADAPPQGADKGRTRWPKAS